MTKTWEEWSREVGELMLKDIGEDPAGYERPDEALRGFYEDGDEPQDARRWLKHSKSNTMSNPFSE